MTNRDIQPELPDAIKAMATAVVAAAAFETAASTLFSASGLAQVLIPIVSATGLIAICLYVVFAVRRLSSLMVPGGGTHHGRTEPKYGRALRVFCGTAAVVFLAVLIHRCWEVRPSAFTGDTHVAGVVCSPGTGAPIAAANVEAVNRFGQAVSIRVTVTDDRGFFYLQLQRWRPRPNAIRVFNPVCGGATDIPLSTAVPGTCSASADLPKIDQPIQEWRASCGSR